MQDIKYIFKVREMLGSYPKKKKEKRLSKKQLRRKILCLENIINHNNYILNEMIKDCDCGHNHMFPQAKSFDFKEWSYILKIYRNYRAERK